ncbi:MAG: SlyX family protein [Alphaproteobacteria bacterium]|nr:SlyX family protein [Alphaproteobacteria bacterium]
MQTEERFINIEMVLSEQQKMLEELNQVVIEQSHKIDKLYQQNQYLLKLMDQEIVKPQNEETPPPHY